jgi:hypothetical protein
MVTAVANRKRVPAAGRGQAWEAERMGTVAKALLVAEAAAVATTVTAAALRTVGEV